MSIRPVDLNVLVPKAAEISKIEQTEARRPEVEGQQFSETMMKQVEQSGQQVILSNKAEQDNIDKDGSSKNQYQRNNKKKKKEKTGETKTNSTSMFDITI